MEDSVCYINARSPGGAKNAIGLGRPCLSFGEKLLPCVLKSVPKRKHGETTAPYIFVAWPGLV